MTCLVGLHGRASGGNTQNDFDCYRVGKMEAAKLMTVNPDTDVAMLRTVNPNMFFVCRIYENLNNRLVTPAQFSSWQVAPDTSMRHMYAQGVRYFEIHNEPNLNQEGFGQSWNNGVDFGLWYIETQRLLRLAFPEARFGFPGLSPGGDIPNVRYDYWRFLREAKSYMQQADWIGAHAYEVYNTTDRGAGGAWRDVRDTVPGKPLAITEFSSPNQSVDTQAKQYVNYYNTLRNEKDLFAAFSFVVSGNDFPHEVWRDESGKLNAIPFAVGERMTVPILTLPPIPDQPLYTAKVNDFTNIRDFSGNAVKTVSKGTELSVYTTPAVIGGFHERVIVNHDGWNVLATRIPKPAVVSGSDWGWPVDGTPYITQAFNAPTRYGKHEGVDCRIVGTNRRILSVSDGMVLKVNQWDKTFLGFQNYGTYVAIKHGEYTCMYCHMENVVVNMGEIVHKGTFLGLGDHTGNSLTKDGLPAPHLHFQCTLPTAPPNYVYQQRCVDPTNLLPKVG